MRALVLSDTHIPDFAERLPPALMRPLRRADVILHAGDVTSREVLEDLEGYAPVHVALGNNDGQGVAAWGGRTEVRVNLAGVDVCMVHDGGRSRGRERRLRRRFPAADVIVFGHSHVPVLASVDGVRLLNPGSPTWKRRQPSPTYGWITVADGGVRTRIVELE